MSTVIVVLRYLIALVPRGIIRAVTGPIIAVLNAITSLFNIADRFFRELFEDLRELTWRELEHWGFSRANILGIWKYFNRVWEGIVEWSRWALDEAVRLAGRALKSVTDFLRGLIEDLSRWAGRVYAYLTGWISDIWRWITRTISEITTKLSWVADRVYLLLTNPRRFVEWVFGEIWRALMRYIEANIERFIGYLIPRLLPYTLRYIKLLESILLRLM